MNKNNSSGYVLDTAQADCVNELLATVPIVDEYFEPFFVDAAKCIAQATYTRLHAIEELETRIAELRKSKHIGATRVEKRVDNLKAILDWIVNIDELAAKVFHDRFDTHDTATSDLKNKKM